MKVIPLRGKSHRETKYIQFDLLSCYFVDFLKNFILTSELTSILKKLEKTLNIATALADRKSVKI